MDENKPSKFPAAIFVSLAAALLAAAAIRTMQSEAPAAAAEIVSPATVSPASAPAENGEPTSNEISDFPQLD